MKSVKQLLDSKGYDVWSVDPEMSVQDAVLEMTDRGVGALLVMKNEDLLGIVSERDFARKVILSGRSPQQTPVMDIMTQRIYYASLEETAEECMAVMTEMRVRHLPVVEDGRVVGVISIGDLVKAIISDQQFMIEQLTNYIGM